MVFLVRVVFWSPRIGINLKIEYALTSMRHVSVITVPICVLNLSDP